MYWRCVSNLLPPWSNFSFFRTWSSFFDNLSAQKNQRKYFFGQGDWDIWAHFFKSVKSNMGTLVFSRNVRTKPLWTRWKQCANSQNPPKTCPVQTIFVRRSCAHCVLIIILISGYVFWSFDEGKLVIVQTNKGLEFLSQKRNWRWNKISE